MVFSVYTFSKPNEVVVYDSINQLANSVEWQDVLDTCLTIIDSEGTMYAWDDSKETEKGCVYGYSMKVVGADIELAGRCKDCYERLKGPSEFLMEH